MSTHITKFYNTLTVKGNPTQLKKFKDKFMTSTEAMLESYAFQTLKKLDFFYMYLDSTLSAKEFVEMQHNGYLMKDLLDVLYENYQYIYIDPTLFNNKNMSDSLAVLLNLAIEYKNMSDSEWEETKKHKRKFAKQHATEYSFLNIVAPNNFTRFRSGLPAVPDHLSFDEWCQETYGLDLKAVKSLRIELKKDKKSTQVYKFTTPRNGLNENVIRKLSKEFPKLEFEFSTGEPISDEVQILTNGWQLIFKNGKSRKKYNN